MYEYHIIMYCYALFPWHQALFSSHVHLFLQCLAAGSSILNREAESASMRPLAKAMTRQLDYVRNTLREQCLRNLNYYTDEVG